ncbi:MAG: class flavin-dependent oxidoreductase [Solirubrobacterales bacterium]|nr:class flavin-dependent oxidoreductase [Solirubrobacterales bacterium]
MSHKRAVYVSNYDVYADPPRLLAVAEAAQAGGWDGFFMWDHVWFAHNKPVCDPWVALAAIAARCPGLVVGPLITPLARRRVWKVAREAVTLQGLAKEVVLGVGLGVDPEFEVFEGEQVSDDSRRARGDRLDADLDLLERLWSGEDAGLSEEHEVRFTPTPDPAIKLWGAARLGSPERPYRRAGQRLDGIVPVRDRYEAGVSVTPEEFAEVARRVNRHRSGDGPFDYVYIGRSLDTDPPDVATLGAAGMTWFLEDLHHGGIDPDVALRLLPDGPPI